MAEAADRDSGEWVEYEPFEGTVDFSAADYEEAHVAQAAASDALAGARTVLALLLALALACAFVFRPPLGMWTLAVAALGVALATTRWQYARRGRAMFEALADARVRLDVDHERLRFEGVHFERRLGWEHVTSWLESDQGFVLVAHGGVLGVLPKRAFPAARLDELRALLSDCARPVERPERRVSPALLTFLLWLTLIAAFIGVYRWVAG